MLFILGMIIGIVLTLIIILIMFIYIYQKEFIKWDRQENALMKRFWKERGDNL